MNTSNLCLSCGKMTSELKMIITTKKGKKYSTQFACVGYCVKSGMTFALREFVNRPDLKIIVKAFSQKRWNTKGWKSYENAIIAKRESKMEHKKFLIKRENEKETAMNEIKANLIKQYPNDTEEEIEEQLYYVMKVRGY